jgi:hypothetical protein
VQTAVGSGMEILPTVLAKTVTALYTYWVRADQVNAYKINQSGWYWKQSRSTYTFLTLASEPLVEGGYGLGRRGWGLRRSVIEE